MNKKEINNQIVAEARQKIADRGLSGKLDIFPIENVFTKRQRYWNDGIINLFKVHMWDLNEMDHDERSTELDKRINMACTYFKL